MRTVSFLLVTFIQVVTAAAFEINLRFDEGVQYPPFDPDLVFLTSSATSAAGYWEDVIEDPGNLTIVIRYDTVPGIAEGSARFVSQGKPLLGQIFVSNSISQWHADPTPGDSSEFDLAQTLYEEFTPAQQSAWYDGSPPELLEVSYQGPVNTSAPDDARNSYDMFTIMLHEMGHVLGLSHPRIAGVETVDQGDYDLDVDAALVNGATMAVKTVGNDPNNVDLWSHLATPSLMCHLCMQPGYRRLPSTTDVLAIASAAGWTQIDLPRKEFIGNGDWNEAFNWIGNRVPDRDDDASLRHGGDVTLAADAEAFNVYVGQGSRLVLSAGQLSAANDITLEGNSSNQPSTLTVMAEAAVSSADLNLTNAILELSGGRVDVTNSLVVAKGDGNETTSEIVGSGTVNVARSLVNNGSIRAEGGDLTVSSATDVLLDLDGGDSHGRLQALSGNLSILGATPAFDGSATVGAGHQLSFRDGWGLGAVGQLAMMGEPTAEAAVRSDNENLRIGGTVSVTGSGVFSGTTTLQPTAVVKLPSEADRLVLQSGDEGESSFDLIQKGARIVGAGTIEIDEATRLHVEGGSTVDAKVVNRGTLDITDANEVITLAHYQQGQQGTLVAGFNSDLNPRLRVLGTAEVAGGLIIQLPDSIDLPSPGVQTVSLIEADEGIEGLFLTEPDQYQGNGLFLDVTYAENEVRLELLRAAPGDANGDRQFDQFDLIQVQQAAKYLTGDAATWGEGDWNGAMGESPTAGDGVFDQFDIIAAQQGASYRMGAYAASRPIGPQANGNGYVAYDAATGEVWVEPPTGTDLTSLHIDSVADIINVGPTENLGGSFELDTDNRISRATVVHSFGTTSLGRVAPPGLTEEFIAGSLAQGGTLCNLDLICIPIPEPSSLLLVVMGIVGSVYLRRSPRGS